ncbi:hypothetical protein CH380_07380 [Leptospira adleri]|uniref:Uncharacterized protein n=1 Tax=Leptospira adleri TaxID=2023186 RepID=A0A2M9YQK9_9LEPT|nr:hypothetical protein CH380_07380 [Leptospira adleri]PJZ63154.1 hypothetical protein CH376_04745 [Leptospira adleri]
MIYGHRSKVKNVLIPSISCFDKSKPIFTDFLFRISALKKRISKSLHRDMIGITGLNRYPFR